MKFLEFIPQKKPYLFIFNFVLGLCLALCFAPFNVPFLSLFVVGTYFLVNDGSFKQYQSYYKIFFYNGLCFGFGFFSLSMYWSQTQS